MDKTMIPMPPSHWIKLRQTRSPGLSPSMSVRIDEPVVVNPEIDSKQASTNKKSGPEK